MKQRRTKSGMDSVMKGNTGEFYALAELRPSRMDGGANGTEYSYI
jgi:hypothetical protein